MSVLMLITAYITEVMYKQESFNGEKKLSIRLHSYIFHTTLAKDQLNAQF
jgi:hypothetical protein